MTTNANTQLTRIKEKRTNLSSSGASINAKSGYSLRSELFRKRMQSFSKTYLVTPRFLFYLEMLFIRAKL
jgi:hypothetical protein